MNEDLIAPCGMNCGLCIAFQFKELDLNKKGFQKKYCLGCIPRGEHCVHMASTCEMIGGGKLRLCFECSSYPCRRLKALDKRYSSKYHMSMIENLDYIQANGMERFLKNEEAKWKCPNCGGKICCHNGLCLNCDIDVLVGNRKYRWDENRRE